MSTKIEAPQGVGTEDLLGLGLFVIEHRARHRDKTLGPWLPSAAFILEGNAAAYLQQYESIGYMRLRRPNGPSEPRGEAAQQTGRSPSRVAL